ncbi:MAG TPA: 4Fe-4S dicluster domain-containing protein [Acidimicrobiales bacterium]|nr:4Fe-4S dicluster domain-containing protein [Acidimicrobiales bacterium]
MTRARKGDTAVIDVAGLDRLIAVLDERGYRTLGPVAKDGAIVRGTVSAAADLPAGWHDEHAPGSYRLRHDGCDELFGWAVGPQSWKPELYPPAETLWRARPEDRGVVEEAADPTPPLAIVGARPCELAGITVLDRVLADGPYTDPRYAARRAGAFVLVAECGTPSATCFCASMETGPAAHGGFDLAIAELGGSRDGHGTPGRHGAAGGSPAADGHRFVVRVGSDLGASVLDETPYRAATAEELSARDALLEGARARMGRSLDTDGLPALLARNLEHPRWAEVAERCLACGNCTMVCPTCFCSDVDDVTDLAGTIERRRHWASCFDLQHSYLHGGPVRSSTSSRYRQWATHKLSTWHDQFGTSGCVGCGRCIAWCPVGIDLTEEVAAIRAGDGQTALSPIAGGGDR